jgi:hypothetical protein
MPELREVFEMTTKQVEPDLDPWREQEKRQRRANRNGKLGAFAVAAGIGVVAVLAIIGQNGATPSEGPGLNPADVSAEEEVATNFAEAYGGFDADRATSLLADDADVSALVTSLGDEGLRGAQDELPLFSSMLEAMGYRQTLVSCEESGSAGSDTDVRCTFDFHLLGSDAFYRGPFKGSYFDLTVRGGEIVRASLYWETEEFSTQLWEPFAGWVTRTHPEDAARMYEDQTNGAVRLTEESTRLWEARVRDFVTVFASPPDDPVGRVRRTVGGIGFSFRPPSGWERFGTISINKSIVGPQDAEAIIFWTTFPDGGNPQQCARVLSPAVGPIAADLAAAVATAPGTELLTGPSDVTVGGYPAKHVVVRIREDVGCDPGYFYTWTDFRAGAFWSETRVGDTIRMWVLDIDGRHLVIEAETNPQAGTDLTEEIEQIVGSVRFD